MWFRRKKELQSLLNSSRKALAYAEDKIAQKERLLKNQTAEIRKLKTKIADLENNIELLVNNSKSKKIKELITTNQSNN